MTKQEAKEANRRARCVKTMQRMVLLVAVVALLASMTACSGIKDKIPGKYDNGFDMVTFYSDGTYEDNGAYGTGTWTLLDGNVLKLTDFYGETKTYKIKDITSEGIVLESGHIWKRQG